MAVSETIALKPLLRTAKPAYLCITRQPSASQDRTSTCHSWYLEGWEALGKSSRPDASVSALSRSSPGSRPRHWATSQVTINGCGCHQDSWFSCKNTSTGYLGFVLYGKAVYLGVWDVHESVRRRSTNTITFLLFHTHFK